MELAAWLFFSGSYVTRETGCRVLRDVVNKNDFPLTINAGTPMGSILSAALSRGGSHVVLGFLKER